MTFSEKLTDLRKTAGMSQDGLAQQLNISRQAISKWETGTAMPETENIVKLAQIFDVKTDYLLGHTVLTKPAIWPKLKQNKGTVLYIIYIILLAFFF